MKRVRKKMLVSIGLLFLMLPFFRYLETGVQALADSISADEVTLFDNDVGKSSVTYQVQADGSVKWKISANKKKSQLNRQLIFQIKSNHQIVAISNLKSYQTDENSSDNLFSEEKDSQGQFTGNLIQTASSSEDLNSTLTFTTAKLEKLSITPQLMEETTAGSQMQNNLLVDAEAVDITVDYSTENSSSGESTTATTTSESSETTTGTSSNKNSDSTATETSGSSQTTASASQSRGALARAAGTVTDGSSLPGGNALMISQDIDSKLAGLDIQVTGGTTEGIYSKGATATRVNYSSLNAYKTGVYAKYMVNSEGAKAVVFKNATEAAKATVNVTYNHVGTYTDNSGKKIDIGVLLTITNIKVADKPSGTAVTQPIMDFSTNLYSGMVYDDIKGFDVSFQFFEATAKTPIEIDSERTFLTFASLNSNGGLGSEYVIPNYNTTDYRTAATAVAYGVVPYTNKTASKYPYGTTKAFYGADDSKFTDQLNTPGYVNGAVSFNAAAGIASAFTVGSLASRSWTTFMSSVLVPINPGSPTKTVSANADINQTTVDSSDSGQTIKAQDRDELDIQKKGQEQVTVNEEATYNYYINQPTYSSSDSIAVLTNKNVVMSDTLPLGVEPLSVTLYGNTTDGNGKRLVLHTKTGPFEKNAAGQYVISDTMSAAEFAKINFDGTAFTWQIKVKNSYAGNIASLKVVTDLTNQAKVIFTPANQPGENIFTNSDGLSNSVTTHVIPYASYNFTKKFENIAAGGQLPVAEFTIYKKDSNGNYSLKVGTATNDPTTGLVKIVALDSAVGTYQVKETVTPKGYQTSEPFEIHVTYDAGNKTVTASAPSLTDNTLINKKQNTPLPDTGGIGIMPYVIFGGVILLAVGFYFFKKSSDSQEVA